ncbi:ABC transporter substrate-binding protein [Gorillibacterium timonense]|uniref:ABC transporter substrate-binding protein n=1 Tax=Gorillibacterium timonense TaxID=1689269 RepID=UPI00071D3C09|nr:ABC transporter substrate-binding protein [Gorillibacterium timonense]
MKSSSTKFACTLLTLTLVLSMVAGCGGKSASKASEQPSASSGATAAATGATGVDVSKLKPYEIKWVMVGSGQPRDTARIEKLANDYLKDKINATIDLMVLDWGSWDAKTNAMFSTREKFDLIFSPSWWDHAGKARKGLYWPISEENLTQYAPKTKALFKPDFWEASKVDGKLFAIPGNKDRAHARGIVYRKDIAEKLNLDMSAVKSWADMKPIYAKVKESGLIDGIGKQPPMYSGTFSKDKEPYEILSSGTLLAMPKDPNDNKIVSLFNEAYFDEYATMMRDYYDSGYTRKDALTSQDDQINLGTVFSTEFQLKPGKADELTQAMHQSGQVAADAKYDQIYLTDSYVGNDDVLGSSLAISSTSEDPERVLMFLELFYNDKYLNNLLVFGEENVDYTKIDDNFIKLIPNAGYSQADVAWEYGNQYLNYLMEGENPDKWKLFDEFNETAKPDKTLGFQFDSSPVKREIASVTNVYKNYEGFYWGTIDPKEKLAEFRSKLKAAGLDKVIAEAQKQWDDYSAKKGK